MTTQWIANLVSSAAMLTLLLGLVFTLLAMRIAARIGYVDRPGGHKSHTRPTPYGGGVAILLAAWGPVCAILIAAHFVSPEWVEQQFGTLPRDLLGGLHARLPAAWALVAGAVTLFALGLYDDLRPQGPWVKLTVMLAVALLAATLGHVRIAEVIVGRPASIVLTVMWILVVINALNFLDNMDGLSAGVAAICTVFLILCGLMAGQILVPALGALFFGTLLGFLVFNLPPARIFMGDAGSLQVGYMLAITSVLTSYWDAGRGHQPAALAMPLVILAVPLYDFTSVVIIRLFEGRNPLRGDQRHFSHRLLERGLSRWQALGTIYLATTTTALGATLLPRANLQTAATVLAMVLMVLLIVAILEAPLRKRS